MLNNQEKAPQPSKDDEGKVIGSEDIKDWKQDEFGVFELEEHVREAQLKRVKKRDRAEETREILRIKGDLQNLFEGEGISLIPEGSKSMGSEKEFIDGLKKRPGGQYSPEIKEVLDKIDFEKLKSMFADLARGIGIPEEGINFLDRDRVFGSENGSRYRPEENIIFLDQSKGRKGEWDLRSQEKIDAEDNKEAKAVYGSREIRELRVLVHEEAHAISKVVCVVDEWGSTVQFKVGYNEVTQRNALLRGKQKEKGRKMTFQLLNEGVTEKLARELTLKYLEDNNWPRGEIDVFEDSVNKHNRGLSYVQEVKFVDALIKTIADKIDESEGVVWEAFVSGLLKGGVFRDENVKNIFKQIFGEEFLDDLSELDSLALGSQNQFVEFLKKYGISMEETSEK